MYIYTDIYMYISMYTDIYRQVCLFVEPRIKQQNNSIYSAVLLYCGLVNEVKESKKINLFCTRNFVLGCFLLLLHYPNKYPLRAIYFKHDCPSLSCKLYI